LSGLLGTIAAMDQALQTLTSQVRDAAAARRPLRIRGGGSKDFYGQTNDATAEVLDTRPLSGIVAHEPTELVVTVRGGTPLAELEAVLASTGQHLPFEPPHFATNGASTATVGGMVAAGLNGPGRASAGAVRDFVLGAQVLNGRAELLTFGGQVMKNVAGYDVSRSMAASMGTLGVLVEVSLKVLPMAPAEATLCFDMDQPTALAALNRWGGQPLPLNASCWVQDQERSVLYVRLRGAVAAVEAACNRMGGQRIDNATVAADWAACREQTLPFFAQAPAPGNALWRVSLPQTAPALVLGGRSAEQQLVEWHGALRWVWAPAVQAQAIRAAALAAGGHATLFRPAVEADRAVGVFTPLSAPLAAIHRRLKAEFDPAGIFNPGRLYADV
jgi:glycolate oxidase FAD binding subunit